MSSKELAIQNGQITPTIVGLDTLEKAADYVVKSRLFGVSTKEQAISLMLLAQAEGIHPMRAIQEYHIIQGRPALKADAMLARFLKAGGKVTWHEISDKRCKATFEHPQGGKATIEWTIEMAKNAGLFDKQGSNWKKYPRAMLRARVISEGIRTVYPVVIVGTYTPEEVQDIVETSYEVTSSGDVVNTQTGEVIESKADIPVETPQEEWTLEKIKEVATPELKEVVKKYKVSAQLLLKLFKELKGDQSAIIDTIIEMRGKKPSENGEVSESKGDTENKEVKNGTQLSLTGASK